MKKNNKKSGNKRIIYILAALVLIAAFFFSTNDSYKDTAAGSISSAILETVVSTDDDVSTPAEETPAAAEALPEGTKDENAEKPDTASEADAGLAEETSSEDASEALIDEDGSYFLKDEVALYIHTYGHLPSNFVTKDEAEAAGWSGGSVQKYLPGKAIGGDSFGNREGLLPKASGRKYYECDIDTDGASARGAKRIIFSNDGLVYYTEDHYESFELLYGEP